MDAMNQTNDARDATPHAAVVTCDRVGCKLAAEYERLTADINARGFNLNEPGGRIERLCAVHASEVRQYVGGRVWKAESA
jgi:hypothetical protein